MRYLIERLHHFIVVTVMARRLNLFIAPSFPIKVDRVKDYWFDQETDEPVYRGNAHQIMRDSGQTECTTMHPDDYHPGSVFGCVACDVEGCVYVPMSLHQRIVLGSQHNRTFQEAMSY